MTFNLDFALFYAYTLTLFAFLALWLIPQLLRALLESAERWINARHESSERDEPPRSLPRRPVTRLEAFTRV